MPAKTALILLALCVGTLGLHAANATATDNPLWKQVYQDALDSSKRWSDSDVTDSPNVGKIRGPFQAQAVTLGLLQLPEHKWVRVRFNLLVRGTWDGNSTIWGPDLWSMSVRGAQRLIFATICNLGDWAGNNAQSFPDDFSTPVDFPARTGADKKSQELNTHDAVQNGLYTSYPIEVVFPHTDQAIRLNFEGIYDDADTEQSWGISHLTVDVATDAPTPDASTLASLWIDLASGDPAKANQALWKFVGAGDFALAFLNDRLAAMQNGTEPLPKAAAGQDQLLQGIRLRRADRIARIIGGVKVSKLCFGLEQCLPEY